MFVRIEIGLGIEMGVSRGICVEKETDGRMESGETQFPLPARLERTVGTRMTH
jgi:hypothetical protein